MAPLELSLVIHDLLLRERMQVVRVLGQVFRFSAVLEWAAWKNRRPRRQPSPSTGAIIGRPRTCRGAANERVKNKRVKENTYSDGPPMTMGERVVADIPPTDGDVEVLLALSEARLPLDYRTARWALKALRYARNEANRWGGIRGIPFD